MRLVAGKVEGGRVVVEEPLPEGVEVAVVAPDGEEGFDLDESQVRALMDSLEEADRGELVPAEQVIEALRRRP